MSVSCICKTFHWSQLFCVKSASIPHQGGMHISLSLYFDSFPVVIASSSGVFWFFGFIRYNVSYNREKNDSFILGGPQVERLQF